MYFHESVESDSHDEINVLLPRADEETGVLLVEAERRLGLRAGTTLRPLVLEESV
jgi:hypothetical protein